MLIRRIHLLVNGEVGLVLQLLRVIDVCLLEDEHKNQKESKPIAVTECECT